MIQKNSIPGVVEAQLATTRAVPSQFDLLANDERTNYEIVTVTLKATTSGGTFPQDSPIQRYPGTELTLLELIGATRVGVRIGKGKKFVPLSEGDQITRDFQEFTVRNLMTVAAGFKIGWPNNPALECTAIFLVGPGPILKLAPKRFGFSENFPIWAGTATTGGVTLVSGLTSNPNWQSDNPPMPGKGGGTLIVRNLDTAIPIYIYSGPAGLFDPGAVGEPSINTSWELAPRESLTIDLKGRNLKLCAATTAGTARFNVMCSDWADLTDPTSGLVNLS